MATTYCKTVFAATLAATLCFTSASVLAQAQGTLVIKRDGQEKLRVTLDPNVNVSLSNVGTQSTIEVECAGTGTVGQCADPIGSGGNPPPAFTLTASAYDRPLGTDGNPVPGSQFNLAPTPGSLSSLYQVCERTVTINGSTVAGGGATNWTGYRGRTDAGSLVSLNAPEASYRFALTCFADTGSSRTETALISTGPGQFTNCPSLAEQGLPGLTSFNRNTSQTRFTQLLLQSSGLASSDFPQTQGLAHVGVVRNEFLSLEFTAVPKLDNNGDGGINIGDFNPLEKRLSWLGAQGTLAPSSVAGTYITISKCPGDFRVPTAAQVTEPNNPPTLNRGCRNILTFQGIPDQLMGGMQYAINAAPNNTHCALVYGETYFLNMMTANPLDGLQPNEHNCSDPFSRCGMQLEAR